MSRILQFELEAWRQYLDWQSDDKRTLRKINSLIKSALRTPTCGEGSPEELRGDLAGHWSRRINHEHRLVYSFTDDVVLVLRCKGHYQD
ncbi:MAG: Txe/YoeB family addiction module toxin [Bifidobacteriaceae bacterium]|jgi:toxin YoeB|nr:Txe/YoeB family addiction module toxin [Bifidobacteriaceae bacterium]